MIVAINYIITVAGLLFCFYIMMSKRVNTSRSKCAARINLWIVLWICLLLAVGFVPTYMTTLARTIALIINVLEFKDRLRFKQ